MIDEKKLAELRHTEQEIDKLMEDMTDDITCGEIRDRIAAIAKEAVLEAFDNKFKNEHKRCLEIVYAKGFADAREKAAKVACDSKIWDGGIVCAQIRALTPGEACP